MTYLLGALVPLEIKLTDEAGTPVNGADVVCTVTLPDGTTATPTPVNPTTGTYRADYVPTAAGLHGVRWTSTTPTLAHVDVFDVRPAMPAMLVSLADAKKKCKIDPDVTEHDETLRDWIEAVTLAVEDHLHEAVIRRTVVEDIDTDYENALVLGTTPVISLTSVQTTDGGTVWTVGDLEVDRDTGIVTAPAGISWFHGRVRCTYTAGRTVPPANYTKACLIIVEHLWQTERPQSSRGAPSFANGYQDSMSTGAFGSLGFAVPNRAIELLGKPPVMGA
jgi:hypothetical protein